MLRHSDETIHIIIRELLYVYGQYVSYCKKSTDNYTTAILYLFNPALSSLCQLRLTINILSHRRMH